MHYQQAEAQILVSIRIEISNRIDKCLYLGSDTSHLYQIWKHSGHLLMDILHFKILQFNSMLKGASFNIWKITKTGGGSFVSGGGGGGAEICIYIYMYIYLYTYMNIHITDITIWIVRTNWDQSTKRQIWKLKKCWCLRPPFCTLLRLNWVR